MPGSKGRRRDHGPGELQSGHDHHQRAHREDIIMTEIPKCMSTQHPDNANSPFFAENTELGGEDEIQEAYYAFSH